MNFLERLKSLLPGADLDPEARAFRTIVFGLIVSTILIVVIAISVFFFNVQKGDPAVVPDVRNMTFIEATLALQERNLVPFVELRYTSEPSLKGLVIEQDPRFGISVKEGKKIKLVVSKGVVASKVNEYIGKTIDDVKLDLASTYSHFDPLLKIKEPLVYVYDNAPAGTILMQTPSAGTELSDFTELELVLSRGSKPTVKTAPNYKGIYYEQVLVDIARRNIPFAIVPVENDEATPGTIVEQSPKAGSELLYGNSVTLEMALLTNDDDEKTLGFFDTKLPEYPISVDLKVEIQDPKGEKRILFEMKHSGGRVAFPYIEEPNSAIILSVNDEVMKHLLVEAE